MTDQPSPLSYGELNQLFRKLDVEPCPAELDGVIAALICVDHVDAAAQVRAEFFRRIDLKALDQVLSAWCKKVAQGLSNSEFDFQPFLPNENQTANLRVAALADWSHGFLFGLALGDFTLEDLSSEGREALDDLTRFAGLPRKSENEEADDFSLAELEEHLRVSVMLIRQELADDISREHEIH